MPFPFSNTSVFAVPRSIARSLENAPKIVSDIKLITPQLFNDTKDAICSSPQEKVLKKNERKLPSFFHYSTMKIQSRVYGRET
jgi:hypothetical protein